MTQIVDASALGAVLFGEDAEFWVRARTRGQNLIAPVLLPFEVGNLCWKRMRRMPDLADQFMAIFSSWLASTVIRIEPVDSLGALRLAREHDLTFYDASYLWLARHLNAELVTLDRALAQAAARFTPGC